MMRKYWMRNLIDIITGAETINESVVTYIVQRYDPDQTQYPIYRNGNKRDVSHIRRAMKDVPDRHIRALLCRNGDLYFWDAYAASHIEIINRFALGDALHLVLKPAAVQLGWGRQRAPDDAAIAAEVADIRGNGHIRQLYGPEIQVDLARTIDENVVRLRNR